MIYNYISEKKKKNESMIVRETNKKYVLRDDGSTGDGGSVVVLWRVEIEMCEIKKDLLGVCYKRDLTAGVAEDLVKREI